MIEFIKKVWAGPFSVKVSLIFVLFVVLVMFLGNPGLMLFSVCFFFAMSQIFNWLFKDE
jgi:ABC-type bacteriocin/lantibiotic exporter with double-glycine peptidase domain